jgi:hypothetical protein
MTGLGYVSVSGCHASLSLLESMAYGREEVRLRLHTHVEGQGRVGVTYASPAWLRPVHGDGGRCVITKSP